MTGPESCIITYLVCFFNKYREKAEIKNMRLVCLSVLSECVTLSVAKLKPQMRFFFSFFSHTGNEFHCAK